MVKTTPAMGFNTWNTFGTNISDAMIRETADAMVEKGFLDLGYEYLVIDDCWSERVRGSDGRIVPSREKFPNGMKAVADYVHSKGLKFGMYSCAGNLTCGGYPSSFEHEFVDAETFASWGVDYLKYDYCYKPINAYGPTLYRRMGMALANCGRDILFSACSWGADQTEEWIKSTGAHLWRSTGDINDSWASIKALHEQQVRLQPYNGQGCANDMDMLVVGMNGSGNVGLTGCSFEEYRTHFTLWALLNSPLMIGCDIRSMDENAMKILSNRELIAINQDPAQRQPYLVNARTWPSNTTDFVWVKQLDNGDLAIGMFNMGDGESQARFSMYDLGLGLSSGRTLEMTELWSGEKCRVDNETFHRQIKPHDCLIYRAKLIKA